MQSKPKFKRWLLPLLLLSAVLVCQTASSASLFSSVFKTFKVVNSTCTSNCDVSRKKAKELTEGTVTNEKINNKDEKEIEELLKSFELPRERDNHIFEGELKDYYDDNGVNVGEIEGANCGGHTAEALRKITHAGNIVGPLDEPVILDNGVKIYTIKYTKDGGRTVRTFIKTQFPDSMDIRKAVNDVIAYNLKNENNQQREKRETAERNNQIYKLSGEVNGVKILVIIKPELSNGNVIRKIWTAYPDYPNTTTQAR